MFMSIHSRHSQSASSLFLNMERTKRQQDETSQYRYENKKQKLQNESKILYLDLISFLLFFFSLVNSNKSVIYNLFYHFIILIFYLI